MIQAPGCYGILMGMGTSAQQVLGYRVARGNTGSLNASQPFRTSLPVNSGAQDTSR